VYGNMSQRFRRWVDFLGSLFFMLPAAILLWWFAWPIATNSMFKQRPINIFSDKSKWRDFKWESSGTAEFSWVWAFKALIVVFAALLFLQAVTFLLRNLWAILEPEENVETHPVWKDIEAQRSATDNSDPFDRALQNDDFVANGSKQG